MPVRGLRTVKRTEIMNMEWIKKENTQKATANGYEIEITERNGLYSATCYKTANGKKTVHKKYRPRKALGYLKTIIENDSMFKEKTNNNSEPTQELWWLRY